MNSNPFDTTRAIPDSMSQQEVRALNAAFDAGKVTAVPTGQVLRVPKQAGGLTASQLLAAGHALTQVRALSGSLHAAGKIHAQAFGASTIPGLIDALAKCQEALAEFLPKGDPADIAPAATPSEALANQYPRGMVARGEQVMPQGAVEPEAEQVADGQAPRPISYDAPHAVNELVATAYKATRDALDVLESQKTGLDWEIDRQRERLEELTEFFGSREKAQLAVFQLERHQ